MQDVEIRARRAAADRFEPLFFTPFVSSPMRVEPEWIDYNGHLNVAYHNVLFDRAVDEAFLLCGLGPDYARDRGFSYFVVEARMGYRREIGRHDRVRVTLQLLDVDDKRMRYAMEMRDMREGALVATSEQLALHVDMASRKAAPFPADISAALQAMRIVHSARPAPDWAGQPIVMGGRARRH